MGCVPIKNIISRTMIANRHTLGIHRERQTADMKRKGNVREGKIRGRIRGLHRWGESEAARKRDGY